MAKKIMVVDDSRIVQLQLQKILSDTDYEVVACCQSGEEALNVYEKVQPEHRIDLFDASVFACIRYLESLDRSRAAKSWFGES